MTNFYGFDKIILIRLIRRGTLKGFNIQQMLKQAQNMQKKMQDAQDELQGIELTGEAGGGSVKIVMTAKHDIKSVKIKPEAINAENPESVDEETIEMLEDLVLSALQDANKKVSEVVEQKMGSIAGGLPINIPGLF